MTASERRARRKRQRKLLLLSALVWIPVLVVAGLLIRTSMLIRAGIDTYDDARYPDSVSDFHAVESDFPLDQWQTWFNLGTAEAANGDLDDAKADLLLALETVPDEDRCTVQINRAVILEVDGDTLLSSALELRAWYTEAATLVQAGQDYPAGAAWGDATPQELSDQSVAAAEGAAAAFADALEARQDPTCDDLPDKEKEKNQQKQDELETKHDQSEDATTPPPEPTPPPSPDPNPTPTPTPTPDPVDPEEQQRIDDLNQRNADAADDAERIRQENENGDSDDWVYTDKGW